MLVLTRQLNKSIVIGDGIEITVIEIRGVQVRLGVSAPKDVPVHRKEIWQEGEPRGGGNRQRWGAEHVMLGGEKSVSVLACLGRLPGATPPSRLYAIRLSCLSVQRTALDPSAKPS